MPEDKRRNFNEPAKNAGEEKTAGGDQLQIYIQRDYFTSWTIDMPGAIPKEDEQSFVLPNKFEMAAYAR